MIRLVHIRAEDEVMLDADGEGVACFAWFDTITDRFIDFGGEQVWYRWLDFRIAHLSDPDLTKCRAWHLERLRQLWLAAEGEQDGR